MRNKKNGKKHIAVGILIIVLAITGIGNLVIYIINLPRPYINILPTSLVVGTSSGPYTLDPVNCWDQSSSNVLEQVVETLFTYNLSNLNLPRMPLLAETWWWQNATILHIKLREGIFFHDSTTFNANATKWNLDRLLYLTNATGTLPSSMTVAEPASLYYFSDEVTPIINHIDAETVYNVTIYLNSPFAPLLDLLCHISSAMVSPNSTPSYDYIPMPSGVVVGTGPFSFGHFIPNLEVRFDRFDNYWQGSAYFYELFMVSISDPTIRNNAMLNHEIHWLRGFTSSYLPFFEADPTITVKHFTDDIGLPGLLYQYLGMNNILIPSYWRKAISYAINYSYIINELMQGTVIRANSPISPGYGASYNASNSAADYDLMIARQTIIDNVPAASGFPLNNDPLDITWSNATLFTVNYTYYISSSVNFGLLYFLESSLSVIGVQVIDDGVPLSAYLRKLFYDQDELGLFWMGWFPDYKDPFIVFDPLFNPTSYANFAQVNDTKLNIMMELAIRTTDNVARNIIYKNIQWYLANRFYPHCFVCHSKIIYVHSADLQGVYYNALNKLAAYSVYI
ncbi:MAG: ABC transporter substrate-binding protein [Promethearchaeota archaeon]